MQIDILPELSPSGGYENIITAIDVFARYAFAYTVSNPTAVNSAKVIIDIMTRHAYLPTIIITDKGSVFVSQVINEVAEILGKNLKYAQQNTHKLSGARTGPRHNQDLFENGISRIQETMAQIFTHCNPELQYDIPFQYRL